jgi:hypothetical protein
LQAIIRRRLNHYLGLGSPHRGNGQKQYKASETEQFSRYLEH